jgi:hypothetical protein
MSGKVPSVLRCRRVSLMIVFTLVGLSLPSVLFPYHIVLMTCETIGRQPCLRCCAGNRTRFDLTHVASRLVPAVAIRRMAVITFTGLSLLIILKLVAA